MLINIFQSVVELLILMVYCINAGQIPPHVPSPQVQSLGAAIPNMQTGLVPPPTSITAQVPIEDIQQPLEDSGDDNQLESSYVDDSQELEPDLQDVPLEPGE